MLYSVWCYNPRLQACGFFATDLWLHGFVERTCSELDIAVTFLIQCWCVLAFVSASGLACAGGNFTMDDIF